MPPQWGPFFSPPPPPRLVVHLATEAEEQKKTALLLCPQKAAAVPIIFRPFSDDPIFVGAGLRSISSGLGLSLLQYPFLVSVSRVYSIEWEGRKNTPSDTYTRLYKAEQPCSGLQLDQHLKKAASIFSMVVRSVERKS